jgi:hypothetical protein
VLIILSQLNKKDNYLIYAVGWHDKFERRFQHELNSPNSNKSWPTSQVRRQIMVENPGTIMWVILEKSWTYYVNNIWKTVTMNFRRKKWKICFKIQPSYQLQQCNNHYEAETFNFKWRSRINYLNSKEQLYKSLIIYTSRDKILNSKGQRIQCRKLQIGKYYAAVRCANHCTYSKHSK